MAYGFPFFLLNQGNNEFASPRALDNDSPLALFRGLFPAKEGGHEKFSPEKMSLLWWVVSA
jgi:hypothetical protein